MRIKQLAAASLAMALITLSFGSLAVSAQSENVITMQCPGTTPVNFTWSAAGPAPQTLSEAQSVLNVSNTKGAVSDTEYMTALNLCEGNDVIIGWAIGTTSSQNAGIDQVIDNLPAYTCVDYDPGSSTINGGIAYSVDYTPMWRRSKIGPENTSASGLKFTVYWTPCDQDDDNSYAEGVAAETNVMEDNSDVFFEAETMEDDSDVYFEADVIEDDPEVFTCPNNDPSAFVKATVVGKSQDAKIRKVRRVGDNGYVFSTMEGKFKVERPNNRWVLHTPNTENRGLKVGETETLNVVTIYCEA